jgi:hypothetical protein
MAEKALGKRNGNAPEDQRAAFDQSMRIISKTYPEQPENLIKAVDVSKVSLGKERQSICTDAAESVAGAAGATPTGCTTR